MKSFFRQFAQAVELFNRGFFFECHDLLESIWLDAPSNEKGFYQGILHIAVGLYHFEAENFKGCINQINKAEIRFQPFLDAYRGVELRGLLADAEKIKGDAHFRLTGNKSELPPAAMPRIQWEATAFDG